MSANELPVIGGQELAELARAQTSPCTCVVATCQGWESVSDDRWPAAQMQLRGTLRQPLASGETEATYEEYHPAGTRYASVDAPIAVNFFPFNRCDVYACNQCGGAALKYTEYGGYYIDHRVRQVKPELIVQK